MCDQNVLFYIYVLELENDKFYVGKSHNPISRIGEHMIGFKGAEWTHLYKPVKIIEIIKSNNGLDEDFTTIRYMKNKGIDNVRGGSFCELNLSIENLKTFEKMFAGSDNKCYFCGSMEHFIDKCPEKNKTRQKIKKSKNKKNKKKNKILEYYEGNLIAQKSNIINNLIKEQSVTNDSGKKYECTYCKKIFSKYKEKMDHENILCKKNYKIQQLDDDVKNILDKFE